MGWLFGSSEETNEEKAIDSAGHVNNNIIIQEAQATMRLLSFLSEKLLVVTYILIGLEVVKVSIGLYGM